MIVDSSAVVAIVLAEPDAGVFARALYAAAVVRLSAASYVEIAAVVDRTDPLNRRGYDQLLRKAEVRIEPVTAAQAEIARAAYRDFGRGSGHPARLNFGDCFSYALAKDLDEPLLFKGDDFGHTDVRSALAG